MGSETYQRITKLFGVISYINSKKRCHYKIIQNYK